MFFNVTQLLEEPVGSKSAFEINQLVHGKNDSQHKVSGTVDLLRTDKGIWVTADLVSWSPVSCSRCLQYCWQSVSLQIQEEFLTTLEISSKEFELAKKEGTFTVDSQKVLSIEEAIRQYSITTATMKPLCIERCAGVCSGCGINLNWETCSCIIPDHESQWQKLRSL